MGDDKPGLVKADDYRAAPLVDNSNPDNRLTRDPFVDFLERAARDKDFDVDKLERVLALKERADQRERERQFSEALARVQADMPQMTKQGRIQYTAKSGAVMNSKYTRLEDIDRQVRPMLAAEGFAITFDSAPSTTKQGHTTFTAKLMHRAGHSETKSITLPTDNGPGRNDVQAVGSTTSYARRYLLEMHLNIVRTDEDDDGAGGSPPITAEQARELSNAFGPGDPARFFRVFGCDSFEGIAARDYDRAKRFLQERARK
jgi:hypothetical protein